MEKRNVHAAWSVLLSHEWIYNNTKSNSNDEPYVISDEPHFDKKTNNNKTILMIHNHHQNRQYLRKLAFGLLSLSSPPSPSSISYQCLLIDIRGHGDSDIDDYSPPHDITAAVDDIIDLISSISSNNDDIQPSIVIGIIIIIISIVIVIITIIIKGNGILGSSVALSFDNHVNSNKVSRNTHSEITGNIIIIIINK